MDSDKKEPGSTTKPKAERIWIVTAAVLLVVVSLLGYALYQKSTEYSQLESEQSEQAEQSRAEIEVAKIDKVETNNINSEQQQTEEQDSSEDEFIGTAGQSITEERVLIDVIYDTEVDFTEFYLEYGAEFDNLSRRTEPDSSEVGLGGDQNQPVSTYSVFIAGDQLEPGQRYFYRIVGTMRGDDIVKSDIAAFDNVK